MVKREGTYALVAVVLVVGAMLLLFVSAVGAQQKDGKKSKEERRVEQLVTAQGPVQVLQTTKCGRVLDAARAFPSGPLAGREAIVRRNSGPESCVDEGDVLIIRGDFEVEEGASVTIQDEDGTQATFVDGANAEITVTDNGNLRILVTD